MKKSLADFTSALPAKIPTEPDQPVPWCQLDPEEALDPWGEFEEPELPTIPMTIGPASNSGAPAYNPMSVQAPGIDTGTSLLAEQLNWKT